VLALQRSAGNVAVGRLLRQQRPAQAPVRTSGIPVTLEVERGGLSRSVRRRRGELFVGDRLVVTAWFEGVRAGRSARILRGPPDLAVEREGWEQGDRYVWRMRAVTLGSFQLEIAVAGDGVRRRVKRTIAVVGDADDRQTAIDDAKLIIEQRFSAATDRLLQASGAFKYAYEQHKAELAQAKAAEDLDKYLVWMVLAFGLGLVPIGAAPAIGTAVLGEALAGSALVSRLISVAGGVAGGAIADILALALMFDEAQVAAPNGEFVTAPGKGIAEYASRTIGRPGYRTEEDATISPYKPILTDPESFHVNLEEALHNEMVRIRRQLTNMKASDGAWPARSSRARFKEDPVALAKRPDAALDALATKPEIDWKRYYEALWGVWVRVFYYRVAFVPYTGPAALGGAASYEVQSPGWRVRGAVRDAAFKCPGADGRGYKRRGWFGEEGDLDAFVAKYGDRRSKELEAAARNARR